MKKRNNKKKRSRRYNFPSDRHITFVTSVDGHIDAGKPEFWHTFKFVTNLQNFNGKLKEYSERVDSTRKIARIGISVPGVE